MTTSQTPFLKVVEAARHGDKTAMNEVLRRFYGDVQGRVHKSLAHDLRAHRPWLQARFSTGDVVQEVFRSVVTDIRDFTGKSEDAFAGYLAMIVRNRIIDALRFHEAECRDSRRTRREFPVCETTTEATDPAMESESNEEIARFLRALEGLEQREQLMLRGRMEQSLSFEKLAHDLGYTTASAARRAYYAAEAKLSIRLKEEGGE